MSTLGMQVRKTPTRGLSRWPTMRFGLRTLLALVMLFAVWFGWQAREAQKQRALIAWVKGHGGYVDFD